MTSILIAVLRAFFLIAPVWFAILEPAWAVDLEARDLHVTQAIQDIDQSVRLVKGKSTVVLVRARSLPSMTFDVSARLAVFRVSPGPYTFLGYKDSIVHLVGPASPWTNIQGLFRFDLPMSWTFGTLQFLTVVDFPDVVDEDDEANNAIVEQVTFEETPPIRIRVHSVEYPTGSLPRNIDLTRIASWLRRGFPTSGLSMQTQTLPTSIDWPNDVCNCPKVNGNCTATSNCANAFGRPCDSDLDCGCGWLNEMLLQRRTFESIQKKDTFDPDRRWVALVYDDGGFMRGCSPGSSKKVASGPTGAPVHDPPGNFTDWDNDESYGDWYTAHELGHAYGRPHAACCGAQPNMGDPVFPIPGCKITPDETTEVGYENNLAPRTYGDDYTDLMSYCSNQWMSEPTFEAILDKLQEENGEPLPPLSPLQNFALVVGNANLDLNTGSFSSVLVLPAVRAPLRTSSGDYAIVLRDASGGELVRHAFSLGEYFDDRDFAPFEDRVGTPAHRKGVFSEIVAMPVAPVAAIVLEHLGTPIATRAVSANPPVVTVVAPNGGESLGRMATVQWNASDPDTDPLVATVLYSADDGATWQAVAGPMSGTSVDVDLAGLPGSQLVRFRVMVSDGFLTAQDDSDDVAIVDDGAPTVFIASPSDGTAYEDGGSVHLEGLANDPEDGDLDGDSLAWSSDRQGFLGSGGSLVLDETLVPGTHVVTLAATDSNGTTTTASVTLVKGDASADACAAFPRTDCDVAQATSLKMSDRGGVEPARKLSFAFRRGIVPRDVSSFGSPTTSTAHTFCLYEAGRLRDAIAIGPSSFWSAAGSRGFRYANPNGTAINKASFKAGANGAPAAPSLSLVGKGPNLPVLRAPLALPVVVQLVNDAGPACFGAELGPSRVRKNQTGLFKAR